MPIFSNTVRIAIRPLKKALVADFELPLWIYGLSFFFLSLLLTGYRVYVSNQALQLPLVELLRDPSLYPGDPFASSLAYYPSMLWRVVALCTKIVPLEPLLLTLFLMERLLVIAASGLLAHTLARGSRLATIGAMALFALAPTPILGGGTLVISYFEQTGLSIPFFLLAMASFYRAHPFSWAIWLAIGFNLNSMYGTFALTYFAATYLADSSYWPSWKRWITAVCLFAAVASPAIVATAVSFGRSAYDADLWLMVSRVHFPHHLYPLTWSTWVFVKFGILVLLIIGLLHQNRREWARLFKHGITWTGISVLWLLYAFVAAYVIKSPSALVMQPARGTDLWYCFAGIALTSICGINVENARNNRLFWLVAFVASVFFWHLSSAFVILFMLIALAWRPIWIYVFQRGSPERLALSLVVLIALAASSACYGRGWTVIEGPDRAIRQIADWARTQTEKADTFLVNPAWDQFRALSKRPVFVTYKDGSAILWDRGFVQDWTKRLNDLGFDITEKAFCYESMREIRAIISNLYQKLKDGDIKRLAAAYPIQYWVVESAHPSALTIAFQNKHYKVLKVERGDKDNGRMPGPKPEGMGK